MQERDREKEKCFPIEMRRVEVDSSVGQRLSPLSSKHSAAQNRLRDFTLNIRETHSQADLALSNFGNFLNESKRKKKMFRDSYVSCGKCLRLLLFVGLFKCSVNEAHCVAYWQVSRSEFVITASLSLIHI